MKILLSFLLICLSSIYSVHAFYFITLPEARVSLESFSGGKQVIEKVDPIIEKMSDDRLDILWKKSRDLIHEYNEGTFYRAIFEYINTKSSYELSPYLYKTTISEVPEVKRGSQIKVHYIGYLQNGNVFDSSLSRGVTLDFTAGDGRMISGFDKAVLGMKEGEIKEVTLEPNEAYGEYDPENIMGYPIEDFGSFVDAGFSLEIGEFLPTQFGEYMIVEKNNEFLFLDINHPLAGKTLTFQIELISIEN